MSPGKIVFVGSANLDVAMQVDRFPDPGETVTGSDLTESGGGKSANQAYASAKLGGRATLIAGFGADAASTRLIEDAKQAGVDVEDCVRIPGLPTGRAFIERDPRGENRIVIIPGANGALRPEHISPDCFTGTSVACFALEIATDTVRWGLREAQKHGATTILNPSPFSPDVPSLLSDTDVLILNVHEAQQLTKLMDIDIGSLAAKTGISAAILTAGANGSTIYYPDRSEHVPAFEVAAIDTTGCGDAFTGAVATGLANGRTLSDAVHDAVAVGAYAAERVGAQPSYPSADELGSWLSATQHRR